MKFLVEMWMDGYETEDEMEEACIQYLNDMEASAISIKAERYEE